MAASAQDPPLPSTPTRSTRGRIRTPPAPLFGYGDYEPYSPPRRSSRIAQQQLQRAANRTPSPQPTGRKISSDNKNTEDPFLCSPKTRKPRASAIAMATPADSPQKKRQPPIDPARRVSGTITAEAAASAAVALGLAPHPDDVFSTSTTTKTATATTTTTRATAMATGAGMLITPAKTPAKPPTDQVKAKVKSVARNLFGASTSTASDDDVMPNPRRSRSQTNALDTFGISSSEPSFEIYTDSHERVPEIDESPDNPFYVSNSSIASIPPPEPPRRRSKRQQMVTIPGEGKVTIEEAVRREDGVLITFRGKKQFRKFSEMPAEDLDQGEGGLEGAISRPLTRSSLKPRLLFPVAKPTQPTPTETDSQVSREDEEAATDIEDHVLTNLKAKEKEKTAAKEPKESKNAGLGPGPATPADLVASPSQDPDTPEAPRFTPTSPPATATTTSGRVTRFSSTKGATATPATAAATAATTAGSSKKPATKKRSPFDGWRRVKGGAHASTSAAGSAGGVGAQKRPGEELPAMVNPPPKRTRA
ncbi:uncharacterized protein CTHT_0042920 [Thermochaetoides thermophila DSM 1495]|uniref:Uncharacterized protein n=1 Tax=Chaetomium thermophilum (strain DSM 1495 / CBS 144.50 / IMI 039719) TaxID=759272 RepID=G0SAN6_CHATD|nr:hypothetical protein CTHT_0042920 [Thermochaetoides thermophila DSM 1495]EGS19808.1 hypothetical protein CTHT_0042920 [Thermochaetoides thermophila DSM 1495]